MDEAHQDVVRADPALRRAALVVLLGIVVAGTVAILSLPRVLVALGGLSGPSPGEAVALLVAFVAPFALLAVVGGAEALRQSLATLRDGRFPPRGMRVLRDTPVVEGTRAQMLGVLGGILGATLLVLVLLLAVLTYRAGAVLWYGCPRAQRAATGG